MSDEVTIDRLERAIKTTARVMVHLDMPQIAPTLKRLEVERDRLKAEGDALEHAREILLAA